MARIRSTRPAESPALEVSPMTTDLMATPDGPDPRQWHSDTRTGCLILVGLVLFCIALQLFVRFCFEGAFD